MERIVVDSGIIIKWFVAEPQSTEARRILRAYRAGTLTLLAPDLIYAEVGNIVWKKQRFQGLPVSTAARILRAMRRLDISLTSAKPLLDDAHQLAVTHSRTVYDALYLALCVQEGCRFVTADERLVNAVGAAFPGLVWVANWP